MAFFLLLLGHVVLSLAVDGAHENPTTNLKCTNDNDRMFCQLELKNCLEYNLILDSWDGKKSCILHDCGIELCCCDVEMSLIFGETHTATVWKGDKRLESKTIRVIDSFKPRTPTIISVNESNGNFEVSWRTNMEEKQTIELIPQITYYKKGDTEKPWTRIASATVRGLQYFEISSQYLETSTTYVVKVRSMAGLNDIVSDSSEEWEFTTPASGTALFLAIIITLSFAVVIMSAAMYICYIKLKNNWWDKLPNPKILIVHPVKEMMLQPEKSWPSPVCIEQPIPDEDKQWSQMPYTNCQSGSDCNSTGSSHVSYADAPVDITAVIAYNLSKFFPKISPVSQLQKSPCTSKDSGLFSAPFNPHRHDGSTSGSSDLVNHSYSLLIPNSSNNILPDCPGGLTQTEMSRDFSCHSSQMDTMNIFAQDASLLLPIDPYQQCNSDPTRFSYAEDPSSSSISSGTDTTASCEPESRVDCSPPASPFSSLPNKNPFHGFTLPKSHGTVVVDDDYQPIQNVVAQPDVPFSEERGSDQEDDVEKYQEKPFNKIPRSCFNPFLQVVSNDAPRGLSQHKLQAPFVFLMYPDNCMPISTESDYHSV